MASDEPPAVQPGSMSANLGEGACCSEGPPQEPGGDGDGPGAQERRRVDSQTEHVKKLRDDFGFHEALFRKDEEISREENPDDVPQNPDVRFDRRAYNELKELKALEGVQGEIGGVAVGDLFVYRAELALIGFHRPLLAGIDFHSRLDNDGELVAAAVSVVASGGYRLDGDEKPGEEGPRDLHKFIYSGSGGNQSEASTGAAKDQEEEGANGALRNCICLCTPVRLTRRYKTSAVDSPSGHVYRYDGLYDVTAVKTIVGEQSKKTFKFTLVRQPGQAPLSLTP